MNYINARRLQNEFKLPPVPAREIDSEQTRQALRYRWQLWTWLLCWLVAISVGVWMDWLPPLHQLWREQPFALMMMVFILMGWIGLGRWLAGPAMLVEAAEKARRLGIRRGVPSE